MVANAIKFTNQGSISLEYLINKSFVEFRISDTGIGIPEKFHDKIFERFNQGALVNNIKYGGNGLGLSIAKSYVEMLNGEIWC